MAFITSLPTLITTQAIHSAFSSRFVLHKNQNAHCNHRRRTNSVRSPSTNTHPSMTSVQPDYPSPSPSSADTDENPDFDLASDECPVYCYVACSPTRSDYLERVLTSNVYDVISTETPLQLAPLLSDRLHPHNVYLKREDSTAVNSFKLRGAYNMMSKTPRSKLQNGVIAASAGNHAQGVALAAQRLKIPATIVMPAVTPQIKVDAVRRRGAKAILHGDNFDEAKKLALQISQRDDKLFVPPFDHPDIIAGQATVGLELIKQMNDIDAVFVPIGGGGLIAGIATIMKRLKPQTKIIGVEPVDAAAMYESLKRGERVKLDRVGTFADGVAVVEVGEEPFRLCKDLVDDVVLVTNDEICAAIKDVFEDTRSILEPAGALAIAGLKRWVSNLDNPNGNKGTFLSTTSSESNGSTTASYGHNGISSEKKQKGLQLVAIASGANTNFDVLRHVSERAEIGEGREGIFAITIPERPGTFRTLIRVLGSSVNITEFNYRLRDPDVAHVFVGARIKSLEDTKDIVHRVKQQGFSAIDLTNDEMAKLHVRHLLGGQGQVRKDEMVLRFEFPERPGALYRFLAEVPEGFNFTMFHYRNHGADVGRVLVGLTYVGDEDGVMADEQQKTELLDEFVNRLGYKYVREDDNAAYKIFLS